MLREYCRASCQFQILSLRKFNTTLTCNNSCLFVCFSRRSNLTNKKIIFFSLFFSLFSIVVRYGPVWISSTVIFMLAATANFANWLQYTVRMGLVFFFFNHRTRIFYFIFANPHTPQYKLYRLPSKAWSVDVSKMTFGASIIYSYAFIVPLFVYLALRYAGSRVALVDTVCLYGYSLFIYIPASVSFFL